MSNAVGGILQIATANVLSSVGGVRAVVVVEASGDEGKAPK